MINRRTKSDFWAATALAAGLALRLFFLLHAARIDGDSLIYGAIAKNWLQHGVYGYATTSSGPVPTLIRLPGYPAFLAACFAVFGVDHYAAAMYLQCIVDLATCVLIAALVRRLFGERAALAALWLAALCPFTASYVASPLTETLTLFSITLTFYAFERWRSSARWRSSTSGVNRWLWITGAAMSYSLLLRPEQGLLAAAVIPAILWESLPEGSWAQRLRCASRRMLVPAVAASICVLLPLVPWTIRNLRTFHIVQPLAPRFATDPGERVPLGFQRWYRTWGIDFASTELVYWNYDSAEIEITDLPARAFDSRAQFDQTRDLLDIYNRNFNATPALDARFETIAEDRIHADPIRYYLALPVARLLNMLLRPRVEMFSTPLDWWNLREHGHKTVFATAYAALNLAFFVVGAVGLWRWRPWNSLAWAMVAFVVLRCALLLTLDNSEPRYTLEFFPLLIVWGSRLFKGSRLRSV